jgi:hypothetical protein
MGKRTSGCWHVWAGGTVEQAVEQGPLAAQVSGSRGILGTLNAGGEKKKEKRLEKRSSAGSATFAKAQ